MGGGRCAGGVKLYTPDGKIAVDNTLNARLQVVLAQARPQPSARERECAAELSVDGE
jgi:vacuolar-type H+-ATPase subunit E/Vma4